MGTMQITHHVACSLTTGLMLFCPCPGLCIFVFCTGLLEAGSMMTNLIFLAPDNRVLFWSMVVVMTVSNALAVMGAVWFAAVADWEHTVVMVPTTFVLCYFRQQTMSEY